MADLSGFIGNQSGMGQGLAFVLPESNTQKYAIQLAQQHGEELRAAAQQRYLNQQKNEQLYQSQVADQKLPDYWTKVGQSVNDNYNSFIKDAATYHAKTGKSPFTNPDFIKQYNDKVLLPAKRSKEMEKIYVDGLSKVAADNEGHYTEESKNAFTNWAQQIDKDPTSAINNPAPQLAGTPSGMNDFTKLLKPTAITTADGYQSVTRPDSSKHKEQAYINAQDPRWNNLKESKYGINTNIPDFGLYNETGKRVFYTNPKATGHIADEIIANPTAPQNAKLLQDIGLDVTDQFAKEKLQTLIAKQNAGWGQFITDAAKVPDAEVANKTERQFGAERMDLATARMELAAAKAAGKGEKPVYPTYFQDLSERMRTGVAGSGEEFAQQVAQNPDYKNGKNFSGIKFNTKDPKKVVIEVPPKYKDVINPNPSVKDARELVRVVDKPGYKVTLDSTDPNQWSSGFARLYKDVTGDGTATPSKAMTQSGKGKVPGGMSNPQQPPRQQPTKTSVQTPTAPQAPKGMVTVVIDGQTGQIPADQIGAFMKKYPKAKRL